MKTTLIAGATPAKIDTQIMANLLLNPGTPDEVKQEKMLIGIRNEDGDIYRLIGASKANSFMNAVEELDDLGLLDELHDSEGPQDGFDAIFREP